MNTPTHAIVNLALLARGERKRFSWSIFAGGILPDIPMFLMYGVEKWIRGIPERTIWRERYFDPQWQAFFDIFNSFPLIGVLTLIAWKQKYKKLQWLCMSMLLHAAMDLPLHREDGHHHFFPFSNYQFISPVSYWNGEYFGRWFSLFEFLILISLGVYCMRTLESKSLKTTLLILAGLHIVTMGYFIVVFG